MPADSGMYLEAAVHMHSSTDPTSKHAAYLSSSPEERKTQQLAVSTIDKDTLVKEFTFTIAMRSVQVSAAASDAHLSGWLTTFIWIVNDSCSCHSRSDNSQRLSCYMPNRFQSLQIPQT